MGLGAEPRHILLPQMPTFRFGFSDTEAGSGWICTSDHGLCDPFGLVGWNGISTDTNDVAWTDFVQDKFDSNK